MFTFSAITTCTVIGAAVFISIFWKNSELSSAILWQIIICSLLCTLGNLLFRKECKSRRLYYGIVFLHYLYIDAVVLLLSLIHIYVQYPAIPGSHTRDRDQR